MNAVVLRGDNALQKFWYFLWFRMFRRQNGRLPLYTLYLEFWNSRFHFQNDIHNIFL
jgi:hypothetical protein